MTPNPSPMHTGKPGLSTLLVKSGVQNRWELQARVYLNQTPSQDLLDELPFLLTAVIALPPSANVRQQFGPKRLQFLEDPLDDVSLSGEQRLGTAGVHAIERRLVERG